MASGAPTSDLLGELPSSGSANFSGLIGAVGEVGAGGVSGANGVGGAGARGGVASAVRRRTRALAQQRALPRQYVPSAEAAAPPADQIITTEEPNILLRHFYALGRGAHARAQTQTHVQTETGAAGEGVGAHSGAHVSAESRGHAPPQRKRAAEFEAPAAEARTEARRRLADGANPFSAHMPTRARGNDGGGNGGNDKGKSPAA